MSRVKDNVISSGFRGNFAKQFVIRETNGQPIATKMPKRKKRKKLSEAVIDQNDRFRDAAHLAKIANRDPEKRPRLEAARKPGQSAYNVALSEYLKMFVDGKREPTPTPPYKKESDSVITTKNITLILDTDDGTLVDTAVAIPAEKMKWILAAARKKTTKKVRTIVLRIACS